MGESKLALLRAYAQLMADKKAIEARMRPLRVALFEAHGYQHCAAGDPRRAKLDQVAREKALARILTPFGPYSLAGHSKRDIERARKERSADIEDNAKHELQRTWVLVPGLGWRCEPDAWAHLWRNLPRIADLQEEEVLAQEESA